MSDETVVDAPVVIPPRPLDAIANDVDAAKARHAAAVTELASATGVLGTVVAEYRAAITWADEKCKEVESSTSGLIVEAEAWLKRVV